MSINSRVKNLEHHHGVGGSARPCSTCRGQGWPAGQIMTSEDDVNRPPRGQCPECGAISTLFQMVLTPGPGAGPDWDPWDAI